MFLVDAEGIVSGAQSCTGGSSSGGECAVTMTRELVGLIQEMQVGGPLYGGVLLGAINETLDFSVSTFDEVGGAFPDGIDGTFEILAEILGDN